MLLGCTQVQGGGRLISMDEDRYVINNVTKSLIFNASDTIGTMFYCEATSQGSVQLRNNFMLELVRGKL